MFCKECGKELIDGAGFCSHCGASQTEQPAVPPVDRPAVQPEIPVEYDKKGRVVPNPLRAPAGLTKKEFFRSYSKTRSNIVAAAVIGYIAAGATLLLNLITGFYPLIFLDVGILLVMSLLVHLKQSRVCAVILLAYSAFNCIFGLIVSGQLTGWMIIIAGIFAVMGAFAFHKEWNAYLERTAA